MSFSGDIRKKKHTCIHWDGGRLVDAEMLNQLMPGVHCAQWELSSCAMFQHPCLSLFFSWSCAAGFFGCAGLLALGAHLHRRELLPEGRRLPGSLRPPGRGPGNGTRGPGGSPLLGSNMAKAGFCFFGVPRSFQSVLVSEGICGPQIVEQVPFGFWGGEDPPKSQ